jgi:thiamine pyrophosphokinase
MSITIKEITLSNGTISEQVFIETETGTTIMFKSDYDEMIARENNG